MNKKILFTILGIILTVVIVVLLFVFNSSDSSDKVVVVVDNKTSETTGLDIKNLYIYSKDISTTNQTSIENRLYYYLNNQSNNRAEGYEGIIRTESYVKKDTDSGREIDFLVDIASSKRTYKVQLFDDDTQSFHAIYILCPAQQDLIYPAFECKDDHSE